MTDNPAAALALLQAVLTPQQQTASAAAIAALAGLVERENRRTAPFRSRKIDEAQRAIERDLCRVKLAAFTAAGGTGSAARWVATATRLSPNRVRRYLTEIRRANVRVRRERTTV
jgi:malonyl CoA-acyl carrier protein transacylase